MRIVAIIPCRYDSKRFEGKPLMAICGKPMVQWVYERAEKAHIVTEVLVATDDEKIFRCVQDFGGQVLMTAADHRSGSDRVAEAAGRLHLKEDDVVINIQGDQPAFDPQCLLEIVSPLKKEPGLDMSTLICRIKDAHEVRDPNCVKCVFDSNGFALYFTRSPIPFNRDESAPRDVFKHLGIYAFRKRFLDCFALLPKGRLEGIEKLEQLRVLEHGHRIKVVETSHDSRAVDTPEDMKKLEAILGTKDD
ncbi:MAG: 3-deoxy-manno-octulosonate cytidylyltransferase [Thermodesulfobacteriota bacterium]|nr:3-deoxy-manno-octulosonate cytidylyltransferase [Thermodesulfobacteriota bacterium]